MNGVETDDRADDASMLDGRTEGRTAGAGHGESPSRPAGPAAGRIGITLKLYATLQDLLPSGAMKNAAAVEVAADASLNEIIDAYRVPRELAHLVLINGVFVRDEDRDARGRLKAGDVLAIWPPVAGG